MADCGMDVAYIGDHVRDDVKTLRAINLNGNLPDSTGGLDSEIALRLVDNAVLLLEQAKIYKRRLGKAKARRAATLRQLR